MIPNGALARRLDAEVAGLLARPAPPSAHAITAYPWSPSVRVLVKITAVYGGSGGVWLGNLTGPV